MKTNTSNPNKLKWLHALTYHVLQVVCFFVMHIKYSFTTDKCPKIEGNYIVMANHTTEVDPGPIVLAFRKPVYFVCGEHLFRKWFGKLLQLFLNPIPEAKGTVASGTVMQIIRRTRRGENIMIFPEGSRSFSGETAPVTKACGKMVKTAGCGLVTYRIRGGYFVAPRWGYQFRKGHMEGKVIHVYSKEDLAAMTAQEVTDAINADLYENAYAVQREKRWRYSGKNRAEGLENFLLICPECGAYDSMESHGNDFRCTCCGTGGTYDEYGFLQGKGLKFDSVYDWGKWIEQRFDSDMADRDPSELLFTDTDVRLYEVMDDHTTRDLAVGDLCLYRDRMVLGDRVFPFREIPALSMLYFGKTLLFTIGESNFGITGDHYHAWKASRLYELVKKAK